MKNIRLTKRAEARLAEIVSWTQDRFGQDQADKYERLLIDRVRALARGGIPQGRSCDVLVHGLGEDAGLCFIRAGSHFVIYRESGSRIQILDFVHGARNLERILVELSGPFG